MGLPGGSKEPGILWEAVMLPTITLWLSELEIPYKTLLGSWPIRCVPLPTQSTSGPFPSDYSLPYPEGHMC